MKELKDIPNIICEFDEIINSLEHTYRIQAKRTTQQAVVYAPLGQTQSTPAKNTEVHVEGEQTENEASSYTAQKKDNNTHKILCKKQ
jgi:hypothetical protein